MKKLIRFAPYYCAILLLAGAAWGQVAPQDEPALSPQTAPSMSSPSDAADEEEEKQRHTFRGLSQSGLNVFDPRDRALLRYYYYRHLLDQEREEIETAKQELEAQKEAIEQQTSPQMDVAYYEPPSVIREYRFYQPPIRLDPYMVQRVLQRRAERDLEVQKSGEVVDGMEVVEAAPTPTPARVRSASEILFEQGKTSFQRRSYLMAKKTFEQLNQAAPNNLTVEYAYGLSLFASGLFEKAGTVLPQVIDQANQTNVELPAIEEFYSNGHDYLRHRAMLKLRLDQKSDDVALATLYVVMPPGFTTAEE